ncbi:MAG: hypothetical protein IAF94_13870 [Pirellulaceae bacterium]|nr:hypothetical protein [Pirellulaceae bacterium]
MDPSFQKAFLRDFKRRDTGPVLALFGKHPAWDDHMDDLGLATASLQLCKRLLYIQGIAANAARQQSLPGDQAVDLFPYRHFLLWFRDREMILLRMVESEDGRGRGFFPLVGAVHFQSASPEGALARLLGPLRNFVDDCRPLRARDEVRDLHRHAQANVQSEIRGTANDQPRQESPTREELEALHAATTGGTFVRTKIPVTRYDLAKSFAALTGAIQNQPVLLAQRDADHGITVCLGQPERSDFWFLRCEGGDASSASRDSSS